MKVLFVWDSAEYLRFYDSAVEECVARGHTVTIAINNISIKKWGGMEGLSAYAGRVQMLGVVPQHDGMWGGIAYGLRGVMDFVRYLHPRFAAARVLRARIKRKVLPVGYHWLDRIPKLPPAGVRAIEHALMAAESAIPVCQPLVEFLREQEPDVVLVSPLVDAARAAIKSSACTWSPAAG